MYAPCTARGASGLGPSAAQLSASWCSFCSIDSSLEVNVKDCCAPSIPGTGCTSPVVLELGHKVCTPIHPSAQQSTSRLRFLVFFFLLLLVCFWSRRLSCSKYSWRRQPLGRQRLPLNHFRTAVPLWGQTTQILSNLSPERDCGPKRVS